MCRIKFHSIVAGYSVHKMMQNAPEGPNVNSKNIILIIYIIILNRKVGWIHTITV